MIKNKPLVIISLIIPIILVSYIAYLTPMHSDDFSYYNMGLDWQKHWDHYNTWSGRFVADYISPLLLLSPKIISSTLIAIAAVSMIFIISLIPSLVLKQTYSIKSFILLFLIYWLSNPTLGQTLFWVVGAANYLFTNLIIVIYLLCFILYIQKPTSIIKYILLLITSSFVGFSSENTTWIVFLFSLSSTVYIIKYKHDWKILISFILVTCSFYFMIFSPGNFIRASHQAYEAFYNTPFSKRIWNSIFYHLPRGSMRLLPIIILASFLFFIALKNGLSKKQRYIFYVFCFTALLSLGSMAMSPHLPHRSLSGPILFLLFGISFLLQFIYLNKKNRYKSLLRIFSSVIFIAFLVSYSLIAYSYYHLYLQEKIIHKEINNAKLHDKSHLVLPSFHYISSLNNMDRLDPYINELAMQDFYNLNSIQILQINFDFSKILSDFLPIKNSDIFTKISIQPYGIFGIQGTNIILESLENLNTEKTIFIQITSIKDAINTIEVPLKYLQLQNRNFVGLRTKNHMNDIKSISYSTSTHEEKVWHPLLSK